MVRYLMLVVAAIAMVGCKSGTESVPIHTVSNEQFVRLTPPNCGSTNASAVVPSFRIMEQPLLAPVTSTNATAAGAADAKPGVVRAGSVITILVEQDPSLNRQYVIPTTGMIDFPPLGRFTVEGLTPEEISNVIKKALEKDYFQTANVTCNLAPESVTAAQGVIYILGNVGRQGPLLLPKDEKFTVMKAILAVGGCSTFGNCGKVKLIRYGCDGKKYQTVVNVDRIMKRADFEKDMEVKNDDWILVPEKWINF